MMDMVFDVVKFFHDKKALSVLIKNNITSPINVNGYLNMFRSSLPLCFLSVYL